MMTTLLVCGSRDWADVPTVRREIERLAPYWVIHGAAGGADRIAASQAIEYGLDSMRCVGVQPFPADWGRHGKAAGPIRNSKMLAEGKPNQGLAFGPLWRMGLNKRTGTGDMVSKMLAAGLPVRWVAAPGAEAVDLTTMPAPPPLPEGGPR